MSCRRLVRDRRANFARVATQISCRCCSGWWTTPASTSAAVSSSISRAIASTRSSSPLSGAAPSRCVRRVSTIRSARRTASATDRPLLALGDHPPRRDSWRAPRHRPQHHWEWLRIRRSASGTRPGLQRRARRSRTSSLSRRSRRIQRASRSPPAPSSSPASIIVHQVRAFPPPRPTRTYQCGAPAATRHTHHAATAGVEADVTPSEHEDTISARLGRRARLEHQAAGRALRTSRRAPRSAPLTRPRRRGSPPPIRSRPRRRAPVRRERADDWGPV